MYTESQRVSQAIEDMVAGACVELFADYGVALTVAESGLWYASAEPLISGVMGFVSPEIRGTCLLASERGPIEKACPPGGRARDWSGELANQLIGRLKTKLLGHDVDISLTTPIVLQGISLRPLPRSAIEPVAYKSPYGMVLVWLESEVAADFVLPPARDPDAGQTGELLMF